MNWLLLAVTLLALAGPARAGAVEEFRAFTTQTRSARGDFSQVVVDRAGKVLREASGTFSLSRPGKFRWTYVKPYAQLLVGDGQKVWIYDTDLNQVTIRAMDQTLSATPAALLAGSQDFEKVFAVEDLPPGDGLTWLGARPRAAESGLESARIGFNKGTLEKLEFVDSFGQRTIITVSKFEKNPALGADHFKFTPPKGADVIGG
ncbi:MAG: outer membrane lipoprotein chaperone LolA [Betaproteobacteria bacterium]|nr:outer membrane lipoprotein chaperone LolA [Betaproteobacteria bacterium]